MSEITPNTPNPVREDAYKTELATKLGIDPQYIPESPVWRNEEEIRAIAEMFANMSGGGGSSGGGVMVVHASDAEFPVLDKTWTEIKNAWDGGSIVITVTADNDIAYLAAVPEQHGEDFLVLFKIPGSADMNGYVASSANGYPAQVFE